MTDTKRPFVPPFCPRSRCKYHLSPEGWRWIRYGSFTRDCEPRSIPRFRCCHCRATFSSQSFSTTYYLKRPSLLEPLAHRVLACSGYRQMAREMRCHATTLMRLMARLGRHALLYLELHRPPGPIAEPLVVDGFESFAHSQYQPLHLNLAVGAVSHYQYAFTFAPLRRKGRMTARQKVKREQMEARHGRPDPKAIERSMAELITLAAPEPQTLVIRSDEHPAYRRAFKRLSGYTITHECTPSIQARTFKNPLAPINLADLTLRHNSANHKRETIAFSKRHQAVIERAAWVMVWRNFTKPFSEQHGGGTPAMRLGIRRMPVSLRQILKERLFPARIPLRGSWAAYYRGMVDTVGITSPRRHALKLAF